MFTVADLKKEWNMSRERDLEWGGISDFERELWDEIDQAMKEEYGSDDVLAFFRTLPLSTSLGPKSAVALAKFQKSMLEFDG